MLTKITFIIMFMAFIIVCMIHMVRLDAGFDTGSCNVAAKTCTSDRTPR